MPFVSDLYFHELTDSSDATELRGQSAEGGIMDPVLELMQRLVTSDVFSEGISLNIGIMSMQCILTIQIYGFRTPTCMGMSEQSTCLNRGLASWRLEVFYSRTRSHCGNLPLDGNLSPLVTGGLVVLQVGPKGIMYSDHFQLLASGFVHQCAIGI